MREDIGEKSDIAAAHPSVVTRIHEIMKEARAGSAFTQYWPLPEHRREDIRMDNIIYKNVGKGENY
jgi:hypothetical protein